MEKRWRCRDCHSVLTWEEERHNAQVIGRIGVVCITSGQRFPLCDVCLQKALSEFGYEPKPEK